MQRLKEKLKLVPTKPGVYLMKNSRGRIIYVGKAVSLRNRLRSYFNKLDPSQAKVRAMVSQVADFDYIVTDFEVEALILEANLIKKHKPRYNIQLKDDKSYPYVLITEETYPRVIVVRRPEKGQGRLFGPYTDVASLRETLDFLRRNYPIRSCRNRFDEGQWPDRPCLNYHIKRCMGPCTRELDPAKYREMIDQVAMVLEGRADRLIKELREKMFKASEEYRFEDAARLRDQITALERVTARQKVVSEKGEDQDVVGLALSEEGLVCVHIFFVRDGRLVGREKFFLDQTGEREASEILEEFLPQFYLEARLYPREILLPVEVPSAATMETWLGERAGHRVYLKIPQRGHKRQLVQMATENAEVLLKEELSRREIEKERTEGAVVQLQEYLSLPKLPYRIEAYDISNFQGTDTVASMVVFEGGKPKNRDYRSFKIRTVQGLNDFASMQEVIYRRFSHLTKKEEKDASLGSEPDLVLIDGGKGQLSAALTAMEEAGVTGIPTVGLAKEEELIFVPGREEPVRLPRDSYALHLVMRVRDEAHRFAVSYHRKLRGKRTLRSVLDDIPGIGPKRKKALLDAFGSVKNLRKCGVDELMRVEGITRELAESILEHLTMEK
ncbi:MAG: excinuclease ABC subunit UvrC [Firmicutes bacterium]|nr:excinuclease ABC subunit UvrC [Bacillota bacterium]